MWVLSTQIGTNIVNKLVNGSKMYYESQDLGIRVHYIQLL